MSYSNYNYKKISKEEYHKLKQKELSDLYKKLDVVTNEICDNNYMYLKYLNVQSVISNVSISNAILLSSQKENLKEIKSFDSWKKDGIKVNRGQKGLSIIEPYKYCRKDGTIGRSYRVKKVFDISQTDFKGEIQKEKNEDEKKDILKALLDSIPCEVELVDGVEENKNIKYEIEENKMYIKRGLKPDTFFKESVRELSILYLYLGDENREIENYFDRAISITYMMCKKHQIPIDFTPKFNLSPFIAPKEIRKELEINMHVFKCIDNNLDISLSKNIEKDLNKKIEEKQEDIKDR